MRRAERHQFPAGLELGEEQDVVDQLADLADLGSRLLDQLLRVFAGQKRSLEQRQEPCERRPKLVGDGRRETGAELFVGGEVAGPRT